jgi:hypothetical protein
MTNEELKEFINTEIPVDNSKLITGEVLNEVLTNIIEQI